MKVKDNITKQTNSAEQFSPVLEKLRKGPLGFKVPDGYFDSINSHITDKIQRQENRSLIKTILTSLKKPLIWAPAMASVIVVLLLVFAVPSKKASTIPVFDEWAEVNMAYDESYAEEVYLAESNIIETELENKEINYYAVASVSSTNEPTVDEITEYLKDQDLDTDILNQY